MTKQQLIEKVAAKTELKKSEVEIEVAAVLDMIADSLGSNERVDLGSEWLASSGMGNTNPAFFA